MTFNYRGLIKKKMVYKFPKPKTRERNHSPVLIQTKKNFNCRSGWVVEGCSRTKTIAKFLQKTTQLIQIQIQITQKKYYIFRTKNTLSSNILLNTISDMHCLHLHD